MSQYDISTHVFDTYVADFHGTTVTLFERQSPDVPTNKPVCYDCHGVHNMKKHGDPEAQVSHERLLQTCQRCHPDATENFSATWLGHYEPDINKYPLVYFVDLFYKIFIPAVLGFMGLYVAADLGRHVVRRVRGRITWLMNGSSLPAANSQFSRASGWSTCPALPTIRGPCRRRLIPNRNCRPSTPPDHPAGLVGQRDIKLLRH